MFLVILCIIAPLVEEIYFRYYAFNILKERFSVFVGVIVTSILFMLSHGFKLSILFFLFGVIYALVYEKTKTIWASFFVHGANNLIWFALIYYA